MEGVGDYLITFAPLEKEDDDYSESGGDVDIKELYGDEEINVWG